MSMIKSRRYQHFHWKRLVIAAKSFGYIVDRKFKKQDGEPVDESTPLFRYHTYRWDHRKVRIHGEVLIRRKTQMLRFGKERQNNCDAFNRWKGRPHARKLRLHYADQKAKYFR